jgi:uncharacterized protein (DUF2147 family)
MQRSFLTLQLDGGLPTRVAVLRYRVAAAKHRCFAAAYRESAGAPNSVGVAMRVSPATIGSLAGLAGVLLAAQMGAGSAADPEGVWLTEGRDAAVAIAPCGDRLCGRIVWLKDATDASGRPRLDTRNPDPARRSRPICGLVVMDGLKASGPGRWDEGAVYNPQDGAMYSGDMTLLADTTLRVRAYLVMPFFGQSQIWTRAERSAAGVVEYNCRYIRVPPPARREPRG